jgi:hypothetical protein
MSDWITVTEALCASRFAEGEWAAFSAKAKAVAGSDVLTTTIRAVVNEVRGAVASNPVNTLGVDGTVPPELENACMVLLRRALAARLPQANVVFDDIRKGELSDAKDLLKEVAKPGGRYISPPSVAGENSPEADGGVSGGEDYIDFTTIR